MSDDDYDDELPPITVNSSFTRDSEKLFRMPTAEELATQRAREAECERELQALRASDTEVCHLHTTDSSGSEGETAQLAASVNTLQVRAPARVTLPTLTELLTPMLACLPEDYVPASLLESLRETTPAALATLTEDMCEAAISRQLHGPAEVTCAAAWLCAASVGAPTRGLRRRSRRALHGLLAHEYFADPDGEASRTLTAAVTGVELSASAYLELADATAPAMSAAHFHRQLLLASLARLLQCQTQKEPDDPCGCAWVASSVAELWSRLPPDEAVACVRAAGRVVRACDSPAACAPHRDKLLAAVTVARPSARAAPDRLEVLVAAQKLQLLFREL